MCFIYGVHSLYECLWLCYVVVPMIAVIVLCASLGLTNVVICLIWMCTVRRYCALLFVSGLFMVSLCDCSCMCRWLFVVFLCARNFT